MLRFDIPAARLRSVAFLEGLSYILLLFIAMPLKYLAGQPMAVRVLGSLHGALFVWLGLAVLSAMRNRGRDFPWGLRIGIASLIPFGTFFLDGPLRREEAEERSGHLGPSGGGPPAS